MREKTIRYCNISAAEHCKNISSVYIKEHFLYKKIYARHFFNILQILQAYKDADYLTWSSAPPYLLY